MRVRRRVRPEIARWTNDHRFILVEGEVFSEWQLVARRTKRADMKVAYQEIAHELDLHGWAARHPCRRPFCWWLFETRVKRKPDLPEAAQLDSMGQLADWELDWLEHKAQAPSNDLYASPFRRDYSWWKFASPQPREWSISEVEQLCSMGDAVLTSRERHILERKVDAPGPVAGDRHREAMLYLELSDDEREFLGLPSTEEAEQFLADGTERLYGSRPATSSAVVA